MSRSSAPPTLLAEQLPEPWLDPIADFVVTLAEPWDLGATPFGHRRTVPITGGRFAGPLLSGEVLPGGADWQTVRQDGTVDVSTRYTLRTDQGHLVAIATSGVRTGSPEVLQALLRGEEPDPDAYYFRISARFETGADPLHWLNDVVAVGTAARHASAVHHRTYVVR